MCAATIALSDVTLSDQDAALTEEAFEVEVAFRTGRRTGDFGRLWMALEKDVRSAAARYYGKSHGSVEAEEFEGEFWLEVALLVSNHQLGDPTPLPAKVRRRLPCRADDILRFINAARRRPEYWRLQCGTVSIDDWRSKGRELAITTETPESTFLRLECMDEAFGPASAQQREALEMRADGRTYQEGAERLAQAGEYADQDLVFAKENGHPLIPAYVTQHFALLVAKAGIPKVRLHDLRHTHATLLLAADVHPKVVSERLGHSSVTITLDTYSHVLPTMQAEVTRKLDVLLGTAKAN